MSYKIQLLQPSFSKELALPLSDNSLYSVSIDTAAKSKKIIAKTALNTWL